MNIIFPIDNPVNGESRRDAAPTPADLAPATEKTWQSLEKAIRLVGTASESAGIPANLRGELIDALAALVWVSQSIRCPACGSRQKGGNQ